MHNHKKLILLILCCFLPLLFICSIAILLNKNKHSSIEDQNEIITKANYDIKISFPLLNNKELNKKIKNKINEEKKNFLTTIEEATKIQETNTNFKYELLINYNYVVKDNIYSIHFTILSFTGGAHYERQDFLLFYDHKSNKEVSIKDLVTNQEEFYKTLKSEAKKYILANKDLLGTYTESQMIEKGLKTLEFISFSENSLYLLFPPYTIGPWSSGEILVPIKYDKINKYLNPSYFPNITLKINSKEKEQEKINNVQAIIREEDFYKGKKLVALTFDDGPSWNKTEKLLDGLKERNAKASFFMLGSRIKGQEQVIKRIFEEGHTIGSHSYEHKNFHNIDTLEALEDINKTNNMLKEITGTTPKYLRPPYGNYSKELLSEINMSLILWNVDSLDWKKKNSDKIAQYIIDTVQDGDIVLLHDLYDTSIEGAFKAIDELSKNGYVFVSIDELIKVKGITIEPHKAYRYFR